MSTENKVPEPSRRWPSRLRRLLAILGWLSTGAIVTLLVVVDPLDLHPLDTWIQGATERSEEGMPHPAHGDSGTEAAHQDGQLWTCSMHPEVILEQPGQCPICSMDLVPLRDGGGAQTGEREILFYRNPMDPAITSPVPMKDSMGMDYVPVYSDEVEAASSGGATVTIDPAVVQNMNVLTQPVERRNVKRQIRTVGYLEYDQQKMVTVTTKYSGFVEKVYVNYIGEPVRKGQSLFDVYSPELVQTQEELLSALSFVRRMEGTTQEAYGRSMALVEAARRRLGFWDISRKQIEQLEATGRAVRTLTVTALASGVVMKRLEGLEGRALHPGMEILHIADLSSLWLTVEVFEDQLPWLAEGSAAEISLSYFPGETFTGSVRFVEPEVTEKTRTVGLRLEVPNRDGKLRAGMYATVVFKPEVARDVIAVPTMALLRTGERNLVVVAQEGGRFVPREVELGSEGDDDVEVLSGLAEGERIVTSAQFLIDSESNLREAIQKLIAAKHGGRGGSDAQ